MITFIDDQRGAHGVEPVCKVLPIAPPSTYHEHAAKRADPAKLSARAKRDVSLKVEIRRVFAENFEVYGVRKVWRQLRREGFDIARCTVERLMRSMDLRGVIRGKPVKTTVSDKAAPCPLDHVKRQFRAPRPNVLWVSDFTYVATWQELPEIAVLSNSAIKRAGKSWQSRLPQCAGFQS
jgi:putative transposase